MFRSGMTAAAVVLASFLAPLAGAQAFDPPTTAAFFERFQVPEDIRVEVEEDGSVLLSAPPGYDGRLMFTLREDEVPDAGSRSLALDITVVEDGGGWPEALVGFGMIHGFDESDPLSPFTVGVISPQDGGTLRMGSYTGSGFAIGQILGGSMDVGDTVRLTMREQGGMLQFQARHSGSTQGAIGNDLVTARMADGSRIGFILISGGTYRVANLEVEAVE
ncbi:MAG: hypothetical protein ACFCVH_02310 [Alphaproteobacteria bacterium]